MMCTKIYFKVDENVHKAVAPAEHLTWAKVKSISKPTASKFSPFSSTLQNICWLRSRCWGTRSCEYRCLVLKRSWETSPLAGRNELAKCTRKRLITNTSARNFLQDMHKTSMMTVTRLSYWWKWRLQPRSLHRYDRRLVAAFTYTSFYPCHQHNFSLKRTPEIPTRVNHSLQPLFLLTQLYLIWYDNVLLLQDTFVCREILQCFTTGGSGVWSQYVLMYCTVLYDMCT